MTLQLPKLRRSLQANLRMHRTLVYAVSLVALLGPLPKWCFILQNYLPCKSFLKSSSLNSFFTPLRVQMMPCSLAYCAISVVPIAIRSSMHSQSHLYEKKCLPHPESLNKRTLKKIQLWFRQDNICQSRSSRNSTLFSLCRPIISGSYHMATNDQNRTKSLCALVSRMAPWPYIQTMPFPSFTDTYKVPFYSVSQYAPPTTIAWNNSRSSILLFEQITSTNTTALSSSASLVP
jgi:hypothetical protein